MPQLLLVQKKIRQAAKNDKAKILQRFFKTGPGEYGEGDEFLGVTVPEIRKLVKNFSSLPLKQIGILLHSDFHEERLLALLLLVEQYQKGDNLNKERIFKIYISNTKYINNWDLIDLTAPQIVGDYLENKNKKLLFDFAKSADLWKKRIAMLATFQYIKKGQPDLALAIAEKLIYDDHDLIQKAVGWMLREIGKRCSVSKEEIFLNKFAATMPRTALRYALERMPEKRKKYFMDLKKML